MWEFLQANWHKILIVIIAGIQATQYVLKKTGVFKSEPQVVNIQLPEKGCTITVKPLD